MKTLLALLLVSFTFAANAQDPTIEWQHTIGGSVDDVLSSMQSMQQTGDGGYILGGTLRYNLGNISDYCVIRLDSAGNVVWQNTIGGYNLDALNSIQQTIDGGYILGGQSKSGISRDKTEVAQGSYDYWVIKLDSAGNIVWQNTIGGNKLDELNSIQQTVDGGYILGGQSASGISGDKTKPSQGNSDYWVIKLDSAGNIVWQNTIGGDNRDELNSIQQTADGGFILGGSSLSAISGDKTEARQGSYDYWVIKLDAVGNILWQNTIGGSDYERLLSIQQTADRGYILGGYSDSGISGDKTEAAQGYADYWVIKLDGVGNILWQNAIGGSDYDYLNSIQQTTDGGFILGGYSRSGISGDKTETAQGDLDYWTMKLDSAGNILWQNTVGGSGIDVLRTIQQTADEGYILGGYSQSGISGDKTEASQGGYDYWVVKLSHCAGLFPAAPSFITGPAAAVCRNTTQTYSVANVSGITFNWTPPAGATISNGQGSNSASVTFGNAFISGTLGVFASNSCGNSAFRKLTINSVPKQPGNITGPVYGNCSITSTYSISPSSGATSYLWTCSVAGASIVNNGTSATITFPVFSSGLLNVYAVNACGSSTVRTLSVYGTLPAPTAISGNNTPCHVTIETYSATPVAGATSYLWTVPSDYVIQSGQGTTSIQVLTGYANGIIQVRAVNACGSGMGKSLKIILANCKTASQNDSQEFILSLYPNPANDNVTATITTEEKKKATLDVFDVSGKIVEHRLLEMNKGEKAIELSVAQLSNGIYFLRYADLKEQRVLRFLVQH